MAIPLVLIDSDNTITVQSLRLVTTGAYLNAATVTVTVRDRETGVPIAGEIWPITLPYVAGSDGTYRAVLVDTLTLTDGQRLQADVIADAGANQRRSWKIFAVARVDRS